MTTWHPWRHARHHHERIPITVTHLPDGYDGAWTTQGIFLSKHLGQAGRRCTLTHELVHVERGPAIHGIPAIEERIVDEITARRLITLCALRDALRWCGGIPGAECAEELWVDQATLDTRVATLTAAERAWLHAA
ncbi:hypothetical protein [Tomitella gaofuii]|uniref:hypothetical protein n=1 Tax=Tomitella gaofuii TaxID=2760083 RepID=UPI0015F92061|nr:hypothetical protein [Tomitella gaofuii]